MLRKRRKWLGLLMLPALLFRAFVPVGFMPLVDVHGGISIGFCPRETGLEGAATGGSQHPHHNGHERHQHGGSGSEDPSTAGQHHAPCLFAASAGGASAPTVPMLAATEADTVRVSHGIATKAILPSIIRAQSSRGPPVFS